MSHSLTNDISLNEKASGWANREVIMKQIKIFIRVCLWQGKTLRGLKSRVIATQSWVNNCWCFNESKFTWSAEVA
jgi:hypothetical protein